ncbi:MlaD family protein [Indioceanicola profundi]|uniref:MlaD family protein n=1 Tax=Indioceanicola profundi TaxID=2220096 RepID=UPI000E6AC542|nr:MlaD family protein [Indioceanicola profundi]
METKASYTIVGAFVLALFAALFVFVVWLARVQLTETTQPYNIYFTGTVTGLVEGSPVRYRGVAVGTVTDIRIDPDNVERVQVTVEVPEDTPIKTDAVATLEPVGVTGGVYVEIQGGTRGAPLLAEVADGTPVIASRPSSIAEVLEGAPVLLTNLTEISERLSNLLNEQNQQAVGQILGNLASASGEVTSTARNASEMVSELRLEIARLSKQANTLLANANGAVEVVGGNVEQVTTDLAATTEELRSLMSSLQDTSAEINAILAENREPIRDFTGTALYDFGQLLVNMQDLVNNLARVTTRLERDPSELLFGTNQKGVRVE